MYMLPKMSGYENFFDEIYYVSYFIKDEELKRVIGYGIRLAI